MARMIRSRTGAAVRPVLKAQVSLGHSAGPLRELRLYDQSTDGEAGADTAAPPVGDRTVCELRLERLGVSLIDEEPAEVLYLALQHIVL
eukprot:2287030-Prymnesium_polylepis.1